MKKLILKIIKGLGYELIPKRLKFKIYPYHLDDINTKLFSDNKIYNVIEHIRNFRPEKSHYTDDEYYQMQLGFSAPVFSYLKIFKHCGYNTLLDIGCGPGTLLGYASELKYDCYGIDHYDLEYKLGTENINKFNIKYQKCSIETEELPFEDNFFDIIVMTEVIEHFSFQPLDVLKKIHKSLKKGGVLIITTPALGVSWKAEDYTCNFIDIPHFNGDTSLIDERHHKIYNVEELNSLLTMGGFDSFVKMFVSITTGSEHLSAVAFKK